MIGSPVTDIGNGPIASLPFDQANYHAARGPIEARATIGKTLLIADCDISSAEPAGGRR